MEGQLEGTVLFCLNSTLWLHDASKLTQEIMNGETPAARAFRKLSNTSVHITKTSVHKQCIQAINTDRKYSSQFKTSWRVDASKAMKVADYLLHSNSIWQLHSIYLFIAQYCILFIIIF